MTTEKPILFNGEMVRAILAGRKTQTRRMIIGKKTRQPIQMNISTEKFLSVFQSPYGKPGDTLWVRETFAPYEDCGAVWFRAGIPEYRAGRRVGWIDFPYRLDKFIAPPDDLKWTPSIFMPRWASRITSEVTAVRTEPLQDISEQDAIAEGVRPLFTYDEIHTPKYRAELDLDPMPYTNYLWHGHIGKTITGKQSDKWEHQFSSYETAVGSFSSLWESINAKRGYSWDSNPWVLVIEFEQVAQ